MWDPGIYRAGCITFLHQRVILQPPQYQMCGYMTCFAFQYNVRGSDNVSKSFKSHHVILSSSRSSAKARLFPQLGLQDKDKTE